MAFVYLGKALVYLGKLMNHQWLSLLTFVHISHFGYDIKWPEKHDKPCILYEVFRTHCASLHHEIFETCIYNLRYLMSKQSQISAKQRNANMQQKRTQKWKEMLHRKVFNSQSHSSPLVCFHFLAISYFRGYRANRMQRQCELWNVRSFTYTAYTTKSNTWENISFFWHFRWKQPK